MAKISALELGATLFTPASNKNLTSILDKKKYTYLRSVVVDFEDGLEYLEYEKYFNNFNTILQSLKKVSLFRFIRVRNIASLKKFLLLKNIQKIDGFILPKFSLNNCDEYLSLLKDTSFSFMPSIETTELFDISKLLILKDKLLPFKDKIPCIRFGLEDMLKMLSLRTTKEVNVYDMLVPSSVMSNMLSSFKPFSFEVSSGVYRFFKDDSGFKKDLLRSIDEGFCSKTVIHPNQVKLYEECMKVEQKNFSEAKKILNSSKVVFSQDSAMSETLTQSAWATNIVKRGEIYGIA
ncbi:MAG: hypothetical protein GQ570_06860 [Helicobacteraceae bacterium]|nr:hypothetical protein [Helicobacteraceae bacterium]